MSQLIADPGRLVFRMLDNPDCDEGGKRTESTPCLPVSSWREAQAFNEGDVERGRFYGIFWTVNEFDGERKIQKLRRIISWSVDIDEGSKLSQREKIKSFLTPSLVVETKRGYQVYWNAIDANVDHYNDIQKRLVKYFGADPNARDIARIMRVPFHYHQKDPFEPFLVQVAHCEDVKYPEKRFLDLLPEIKKETVPTVSKEQARRQLDFLSDDSLFERIYSMDCETALLRISGTSAVGGETFSFNRTSGGKLNLLVDGKGSSVFIDSNKRIGSSDGGGPTIWQWINWYQRDHKKTYSYMKEFFPELFKDLKDKSK